MKLARWSILIIVLSTLGWGAAFADDAPDLEVNPSTGLIESVSVSSAVGRRVLHVEDSGQGTPLQATVVSAEPASESRIAIKSNGESWAVWQTDSGEVRCAYRDPATRAWTAEKTVSVLGERSSHPSIAHLDTATWVAFEVNQGATTGLCASMSTDSPEPFSVRTLVAATTNPGADLVIRAEAGHVWLTWVDSASALGWSVYDAASDTWSGAMFESYTGSSADQAREAVRTRILTEP